jgi:hypothetical protein
VFCACCSKTAAAWDRSVPISAMATAASNHVEGCDTASLYTLNKESSPRSTRIGMQTRKQLNFGVCSQSTENLGVPYSVMYLPKEWNCFFMAFRCQCILMSRRGATDRMKIFRQLDTASSHGGTRNIR